MNHYYTTAGRPRASSWVGSKPFAVLVALINVSHAVPFSDRGLENMHTAHELHLMHGIRVLIVRIIFSAVVVFALWGFAKLITLRAYNSFIHKFKHTLGLRYSLFVGPGALLRR